MKQLLQEIQKFNIELYFKQNSENEIQLKKIKLIDQLKRSHAQTQVFINCKLLAFEVEANGRKNLIAKEIFRHFEEFFCIYLKNEKPQLKQVVATDLVQEFFNSSQFFYGHQSFPHYTGVGLGFENGSKFFFFAIERLDPKSKNKELLALYKAMAAHLNFQSQFADDKFFNRFKQGVLFNLSGTNYFVKDKKLVTLEKNILVPFDKTLNFYIDKIQQGQYNDII